MRTMGMGILPGGELAVLVTAAGVLRRILAARATIAQVRAMAPRINAVSESLARTASLLAQRRSRMSAARFGGLVTMLRAQANAVGNFVRLLERVTTAAQATAAEGVLGSIERAAASAASQVTGAAPRRPRRRRSAGAPPAPAPEPQAEESGFLEQYGLWIAGAVAAAVVVAVVVSRSDDSSELAPT